MDWSEASNCELPRNDHEKTLSRLHVELVKLPRQVVRKGLSREWCRTLLLNESLQPSCMYRLHQRRVVTLRLICIGERKRADGLVKGIALAQIATDGRGIPGLGMGAGQGPAAEL